MKKIFATVVLVAYLFVPASASALVSGLPDFTGLMEKAGPAVVNIQVTQFGDVSRPGQLPEQGEGEEEIPEFFRRFFDTPDNNRGFGRGDRYGAGSGFIYDSTGYIITNHHVIEDADQIIVRLADRREYEAELVGSDEASDIALLKIDAFNLPTLALGNSEVLRPGEWVAAIGSPFNFEQSITSGIVSAKGRSNANQQYVPFIQTDVAINQGNSGGPLLNMNGEVVGINSWILSGSGGYIGLSFSIPVEVAESTVQQLREFGRVERGLLGVIIGPVDRDLAEAMDLDRPIGALVRDLTPGGSAENAGISVGDVILEFDQQVVETSNDLPPLVGANRPGTKSKVLVSRYGERLTFDVVLDALPSDEGEVLAQNDEEEGVTNLLGLSVERLQPASFNDQDRPESGVRVANVESDAAWRAGVRPGDVILKINSHDVNDLDSFNTIIEGLPGDRSVALRIWRDGTSNFIAYKPDSDQPG